MCQLTLAHTGDSNLDKIFLSILLPLDAAAGNRDGTGIVTVSSGKPVLWKTSIGADNLLNLGRILKHYMNDGSLPTMAHTRAASKGIEVTKENAHPFEGKRFYLAHNGRLHKKGAAVAWAYQDDTGVASDSMEFLSAMEKINEETNGELAVSEILEKAMSSHMGKFAFLIFDKAINQFFVVRGSSADLHGVQIFEENDKDEEPVEIGYIVNTKKDNLHEAAILACQVGQAMTGRYLRPGPIMELKKETIFLAGKELTEIGPLKENAIVYSTAAITPFAQSGYAAGGKRPNVTEFSSDTPLAKAIVRIYDFMRDHFLTPQDIDACLYIFTGHSMETVGLDDLKFFVESVIPKISAPQKIRRKIQDLGKRQIIYPHAYTKIPDLAYPWMLSSKPTMEKLVAYLKELNKPVKG